MTAKTFRDSMAPRQTETNLHIYLLTDDIYSDPWSHPEALEAFHIFDSIADSSARGQRSWRIFRQLNSLHRLYPPIQEVLSKLRNLVKHGTARDREWAIEPLGVIRAAVGD